MTDFKNLFMCVYKYLYIYIHIYTTMKIEVGNCEYLPGYKASHARIEYFLMLQNATILILHRNYRKSIEEYCG